MDFRKNRRRVIFQASCAVVVLAAAAFYVADCLLSGRIALDAVIWFEQATLHATVFAMAFAAATGRLSIGFLFPALAAGHISSEFMLLTYAFHIPFSYLGAYPPFLVNPQTKIANPQAGTVAGFVVVALWLLASCLLRRTFDRIAMLVVAGSVAVTGLMFHISTVSSINLQRTQEIELLRVVSWVPGFMETCGNLRLVCGSLDGGAQAETGIDSLNAVIAEVAGHAAMHPEGAFFHGWHGSASLEGLEGSSYVAVVSRKQPGGETRWLVSMERPAERLDHEKSVFSYQAGLAHVTWLLGAFAVCWIHSSRRRAWRLKAKAASTKGAAA